MATEIPALLAFDQVRQQIESATAAILQRTGESARNARLPAIERAARGAVRRAAGHRQDHDGSRDGELSNLPLVYVPLESIMSKWVGDSEKRLDAIFDVAGTLGKSLVFLDEIDGFAGSRDKGEMPEYTRRILSVMLRQMQGLVDTSNVVVVGATNRKDDLDPALLSRFTRSIYFPLPNEDERVAILGYYARHITDEERRALAALCNGRSGREIEDGCGTAERMWASELIATGAQPSAPPADRYAGAFRLKFGA